MTKTVKSILKNTLPVGLGVFFIWISLSRLTEADIRDIKNSFKTANYWWILLSLIIGMLSHLSRAYRWLFILEPIGYKPKFLNSTMAVIISYLVNMGIPRAGEISKAAIMTKYEKIPFEKGFGTIVSERLADVIVVILFIALAFFAQYELIKTTIISKLPKNPLYSIIAVSGLIILIYFFLWCIKKSKKTFFLKIKTFIAGLILGIKSILIMKKKWAFIFHTLFIWTAYITMLYTASFALPETSNLPINAILTGFVIGSISYAATNGGIGAYPLAIQQSLIPYGISEVASLSFGWIMWLSQTIMILVFGGLSFLLLPIYNKEKY